MNPNCFLTTQCKEFYFTYQARIQDFLKGGGVKASRQGGEGGPLRGGGGGVITPVGEKLLFEHTQNSALQGG